MGFVTGRSTSVEREKSEKEGGRERERERENERQTRKQSNDRDICSRKETGIRGTSTSLRINAWVQESENNGPIDLDETEDSAKPRPRAVNPLSPQKPPLSTREAQL